jgi:hypothetical protein
MEVRGGRLRPGTGVVPPRPIAYVVTGVSSKCRVRTRFTR